MALLDYNRCNTGGYRREASESFVLLFFSGQLGLDVHDCIGWLFARNGAGTNVPVIETSHSRRIHR